MPNTLAHLGVQAVLMRRLAPPVDMGWIWLGCILADVPWITQRVLKALPVPISAYDIRAYAAVQSSLAFCLVAAVAAGCLSRQPRRVFWVVALGSLLHLLLDALQTKFGNGVLLALPFDWRLLNLGVFWPEEPATLVLSGFGAVVFVWAWVFWRSDRRPVAGRPRPILAVAFGMIWLCAPVAFVPMAKTADVHFVATLEDVDHRPRKPVAFDRARVAAPGESASVLRVWTGEDLTMIGAATSEDTLKVSVIGHFDDEGRIVADRVYLHNSAWRDRLSYIGLGAVLVWWIVAWLNGRRPNPP